MGIITIIIFQALNPGNSMQVLPNVLYTLAMDDLSDNHGRFNLSS